jgi:phosphopantothenoylcysteine decarboxylase/phosphopantothenate--cysteine ligase
MIIAPASANTLAKLAHGFADNALSSLALAIRCPLIVAPAMDTDMFQHVATQENIDILRGRGVSIVEPESGELASGLVGPGRLPDTGILMQTLETAAGNAIPGDLAGRNVLVTAGPTHEAIDPVRYLGNRSSGKMGFAVADAAARRGASVTLVSGPVSLQTPEGVTRIDVESAQQMYDAVLDCCDGMHVSVLTAAVADFTAADPADSKIKKESFDDGGMTLQLKRTPDILAELGKRKKNSVLVGFALETDNGFENALRKLHEKHADVIVLNNPHVEGAGFGTDTNVATIIHADETHESLPLMSKKQLAGIILDHAVAELQSGT